MRLFVISRPSSQVNQSTCGLLGPRAVVEAKENVGVTMRIYAEGPAYYPGRLLVGLEKL